MSATITNEAKQAALHAAVLAKLAYWDAMDALEKMYCPDDDIGDKESDELALHVEGLAVGYPGSVDAPRPEVIDDEHVQHMDNIFA